jgi:hypothetical protein
MIRNCSRIGEKLEKIVLAYEHEALKRLDEALGKNAGVMMPASEQNAA